MELSEKTFCRSSSLSCPPSSECSRKSNEKFFDKLFSSDWEVFVIERNKTTGKFDWQIICCDAAKPSHVYNTVAAPCC